MSCTIEISGELIVGTSGACSTSCSSAFNSAKVQSLAISGNCTKKDFNISSSINCKYALNTNEAFIKLPNSEQYTSLEFLYLNTDNVAYLRLNNKQAELKSTNATFPTGFTGGETIQLIINGTTVNVTFASGDQQIAQVINKMNAAIAGAGLSERFINENNAMVLRTIGYGPENYISTNGNATLGIALSTVEGSAQAITVDGISMLKLKDCSNIFIKTNSTIEFLIAGK